MTWRLEYTKQAERDSMLLYRAKLSSRTIRLLEILENDPFQNPPPYEKLTKDLKGLYSRRINLKHRLVYEIRENEKIVRILRMWSHYD